MEFRYQGERATLGAGEIEIVRRYGRLRFLPGENRDAILRSLPSQDRCIVSEPFANKHGVRAGDRLDLPLGGRDRPHHRRRHLLRLFHQPGLCDPGPLDAAAVSARQPAHQPRHLPAAGRRRAAVRHDLERRLAAYRMVVAPNQTLRRDAIVIFDRTFAITYALEAVAIVVAMLGAANSLLALVLDRRREFGLLRYLGASGAQIRRMVLIEAGFLGLLGAIVGLALGFVLSLLLIFVVNKQSFGWTIQFHPPVELLAGALLLIWWLLWWPDCTRRGSPRALTRSK